MNSVINLQQYSDLFLSFPAMIVPYFDVCHVKGVEERQGHK